MGAGRFFLDFWKQLNDDVRIDFNPQPKKVINNYYYMTVDNRMIKVNEREFQEHLRKNQLIKVER